MSAPVQPYPPLSAEQLPGLLLRGADLVVVDVETTGWLADAASITEIGAVRLSPGLPGAEFAALVNPGAPIPPAISALTGITDAMVEDAPPIGEVLPGFLDFARGSVLVAHNAPFDIGFLAAACAECGIAWPRRAVIDTAVLARLVLRPDEVPDHKLATLACHFGTRTGPCHRALADAKATAEVLVNLIRLLAPRPLADQPTACVNAGDPAYLPAGKQVLAWQPPATRYDGAATGMRGPLSRRRNGHCDCSDQG